MIFFISFSCASVCAYFFFNKVISKKIKCEYENFLLKGDKKMSVKTGRLYYKTLPPQKKKEMGIGNIDRKIVKDFDEFNSFKTYTMHAV